MKVASLPVAFFVAAAIPLGFACVSDPPAALAPSDGGSDATAVDASTAPGDGGSADAGSGSDASDAGCATTTTDLPLVADAIVLQGQDGFFSDTQTILEARNDIGPFYGLLRFVLPPAVHAQNVVGLKLTLPMANVGVGCAGNVCGSCAGIDAAGDLDLYAMTPIWPDAFASWNHRDYKAKTSWTGADVLSDRETSSAARTTRAAGAPAVFNLPRAAASAVLAARMDGAGHLSFMLAPASPNVIFIASSHRQTCPGAGPPATLSVTYCKN